MEEFIKELDGLEELVYLSDPKTYELLYMNRYGLRQYGLANREEIAGRRCYELLQNRTEPCSFCTNHLLCTEKFYEWERYNPVVRGQFMLKDKLVEYGGRLVRMEIALDVTKLTAQERQIRTMFENEQVAMDCARKLQDAHDEAGALNEALAMLGERLRGERTYIFEIFGKTMDNTYEWCAPGISHEADSLKGVPLSVCRHWIKNFIRKEPYVITNLEGHRDTEPEEYRWLKRQNINSLIAVPLFEKEVLIGFLGVDNPPVENGSNIVAVLQLLAYFMQGTLSRIKLNEKLRRMTYLDEMTGAKNRNAFIHELERLNAELRSDKHGAANTGYGVIFADVNGLKELNDTAGHDEGDNLLIRVVQKIMQLFPASDIYRTGGDEFVILCTSIPEEALLSLAERLRQELDGKAGRDSAAVGASWSDHIIYIEEIINQAEANMYEAKKQYYIDNLQPERLKALPGGSYSSYTSLLLRDIDIASIASELLHIIFENWDSERISILLDQEFILFEGEYQRLYQRDEALRYIRTQQETYKGQKLRDLQILRKRIIRGISICSCFGRLDWKTEDGRTGSIPFDMALTFVQRKGRVRCIYMYGTNVFYRRKYERNFCQMSSEALLNIITRVDSRRELIELPKDEKELSSAFKILADSFGLVSQRYSNIYFVDIQKDSYVTLKTQGKFRFMVRAAGNYTGINCDYAERYMDTANKIKYLDFTGRKNLTDNLREGRHFIHMNFSVSRDKDENTSREVEISIWLGVLENTEAAVFAFRTLPDCPRQQTVNERDKLTGLMSYEKFREIGQRILDKECTGWAVISIDFQNFKYVNEIMGIQEGDALLRALAQELSTLEGEELYQTRVTADLFLTLFRCGDDYDTLIQKVREHVNQFCTVRNKQNGDFKVTLRTGIYFPEFDCRGIDIAIDRANMARKAIGQSINSEVCVYGEEIVRKSSIKSEILATMEKSLENGDFQIWLQPKMNLADKSLCGAEALVRWMQGSNIYFYPDDFVSIFEKSGFITSLDFHVLEGICQKLYEQKVKGRKVPVTISVNLSAVDVAQGGIVNAITEIVDRYQIEHSALEFELTETAYFKNSSVAAQVMERLKKEGFTTSVDDFGSGYSVMNMLINMPASVVKIDRMFMLDSEKTEKGRSFLEKLIGIIHELGYQVLCEGIETEEQYQMLKAMGCDEGQGYYFSKPMPMEKFFEVYCG